jgi:hypothetical protein
MTILNTQTTDILINNLHQHCNEIVKDIEGKLESDKIENKINNFAKKMLTSIKNSEEESYIHHDLLNLIVLLESKKDQGLHNCVNLIKSAIQELKKINKKEISKQMSKNAQLEMDGIAPGRLNKCPRLFFRDVIVVGREFMKVDEEFAKEIGNLDKYDEGTSTNQRPEDKLVTYLANHSDNTCKFRDKAIMGGYVGYTYPEIDRNLQAACWNFALAGCCGVSGPNQLENFIDPREFYGFLSNSLFDNSLTEFAGPPIKTYENLKEGTRAQLAGITGDVYEKFLLYKPQIEGIWAKLSEENPDLESIGKETMALFLKLNDFEVLEEKDAGDSPYAVAMYTDNKNDINWRHWGIEVSTNLKTHTFETLPYCSIGHRTESFKSAYSSEDKFVFSIPIKKLSDRQKVRIQETINYGLE